jgi:hypothetical protein
LKTEHHLTSSSRSEVFEYDYTKKAPIMLDRDLATIIGFPIEYVSVNQVKKQSNDGSAWVKSLNYGGSLFNSFSRPTQLFYTLTDGVSAFNEQHFLIYE